MRPKTNIVATAFGMATILSLFGIGPCARGFNLFNGARQEYLEEKANRAEYEGRTDEARLRREAIEVKKDDDAYKTWKRSHGK